VQTIAGLSVAYLSGVFDASVFNEKPSPARSIRYDNAYLEADVKRLIDAASLAKTNGMGVDLLLTAEWPRQYHHLLSDEFLPKEMVGNPRTIGSPIIGSAASQIVHRFHFAGLQNVFFQLPAFRNAMLASRFFGIATAVETKQKNLYATSITPTVVSTTTAAAAASSTLHPTTHISSPHCPCAQAMSKEALAKARAEGVTNCPYTAPMPSMGLAGERKSADRKPQLYKPNANAAAAAGGGGGADVDMTAHGGGGGGRGGAGGSDEPPVKIQRTSGPADGIRFLPTYQFNPNDRDATPAAMSQRWGGRDVGRSSQPPRHYVCNKCNQPGHYIRECPVIAAENKQREDDIKAGKGPKRNPPPGYVCHKCSRGGHWIRCARAPTHALMHGRQQPCQSVD
jgi:hypothetical protein